MTIDAGVAADIAKHGYSNSKTVAERESAPNLYPPNILEAFSAGAMMDLRVRLAVQILAGGSIDGAESAARNAVFALNIACSLIEEGERRGFVKPLDQHTTGMADLIDHAKRQGEAGAHQQLHGGKVLRDAQPTVGTVAPRGNLIGH
jgi:hypothetical protein